MIEAMKQEPWVWMPAPIKTQWGHDRVVADLAIDKDHTVSVYCERDQTEKVEAVFSAQPQREWVGLTDAEIYSEGGEHEKFAKNGNEWFDRGSFARAIEAKLKEKNT